MTVNKSTQKNYVSELDHFLTEFNHTHPQLSPAQRYEREKYARVNRLRDQVVEESAANTLWDKF